MYFCLVIGRRYQILTPMRVDTSRIIPVIQAKLRLTSSTAESTELVDPASSNNLEIRRPWVISNNIPDSEEGPLFEMITPTIFPATQTFKTFIMQLNNSRIDSWIQSFTIQPSSFPTGVGSYLEDVWSRTMSGRECDQISGPMPRRECEQISRQCPGTLKEGE